MASETAEFKEIFEHLKATYKEEFPLEHLQIVCYVRHDRRKCEAKEAKETNAMSSEASKAIEAPDADGSDSEKQLTD